MCFSIFISGNFYFRFLFIFTFFKIKLIIKLIVDLEFLLFFFKLFFSLMRKDFIVELFYGLIGEIFELKGGNYKIFY